MRTSQYVALAIFAFCCLFIPTIVLLIATVAEEMRRTIRQQRENNRP